MKILMVCLGNICRSPLAEGVLRHKLAKRNIVAEVDSAGTGSWHVGEQPDYRAYKVAQKNGIDISKQRARQLTYGDFAIFDKIYVADREVKDNVMRLAKTNADKKKVDFLMNASEPESDRPVPDPYFGGEEGFDHVFTLIDEACEKIADMISKR